MSREEIKATFKVLYKVDDKPLELTEYQVDIAYAVLNRTHRQVKIISATQVGKTLLLALLSPVYEQEYNGTNIVLTAPDYKRTKLLLNYTYSHITDHRILRGNVPSRKVADESFDKEVSKRRLTWRTGGDLTTISGHKGKDAYLGAGGDVIILDESPLIDDDTYNGGVRRMLAASKNPMLIEIGNPVKINHFAENLDDEDTLVIRITWEDAVKAGIYTKEFVEAEAKALGGWNSPLFKMLYCAEFVENAEDQLIEMQALNKARETNIEEDEYLDEGKLKEHWYFELGIDVARYGTDETVLYPIVTNGEKTKFFMPRGFAKTSIPKTIGEAKRIDNEFKELYGEGFDIFKVDDVGLGGGVTDGLEADGYNVVAWISNRKPRDKRMHKNQKSEQSYHLNEAMKAGLVDLPEHAKTTTQFRAMKYDYDGEGRRRVIDPKDSPDYFDAALIAYWKRPNVVASGVSAIH